MKEEEKIKEKQLIFGRYKLIKSLDEGAFGQVYLGLNIKNNEKVAIKLETRNNRLSFLEAEAYFLFILKGLGIPKIETFGHNKNFNILVETLLGKSLLYLFYKNKRYFSIKDVLMMGIQMVQRLKFIHSKYIIHRDIKPENFLIGYNDPYLIYLIDFGLSKKYRSSRTGKHVKFSIPKRITGTARYSSLNALKGYQVSRRDDLESIAYILIFFMKGFLPWEDVESLKKGNKYREIYKLKVLNTPEKLCEDLPNEICEFLKYTRNLEFEQEPNYDYCCSLFNNALLKIGSYNDLFFSWIKDSTIINKLKKMNNQNLRIGDKTSNLIIYDKNKRKSSPQTRLYHTLQDSFQRKKLYSSSNMNNSINNITFKENYMSSDKKYNIDFNEDKDLRFLKKIKNEKGKMNSLFTNESQNIYYKNVDNNGKYSNKFELEKNLQNSNYKKLAIMDKNIFTKLNNITKVNNNIYQSYSERKNKNLKNNIIIEKIDKKKLTTKISKNINNINKNFNINNELHNIQIDNIELAQILNNYDIKTKTYKSISDEKNKLKNNIVKNISNIYNENSFENKENKRNKKEKKKIRITNIYKTKINDKNNFYNLIHDKNNKNVDFYTEKKILINNNNKNRNNLINKKKPLINKNKMKHIYKSLNINLNNFQNNNQLLLNKQLITLVNNNINQGFNTLETPLNTLTTSLNKKYKTKKYLNNKNINNCFNNRIKQNAITKIQNTNKNKINKKYNSFEHTFHKKVIDISNDGENNVYKEANIPKYNINNKNKVIGMNKNKKNEGVKNKKIKINSIILYNNKLMDLKIGQNQILNNCTKNISNFLNYRIVTPNNQKNIQKNKLFYNTLNIVESNNCFKKEKNNSNINNNQYSYKYNIKNLYNSIFSNIDKNTLKNTNNNSNLSKKLKIYKI